VLSSLSVSDDEGEDGDEAVEESEDEVDETDDLCFFLLSCFRSSLCFSSDDDDDENDDPLLSLLSVAYLLHGSLLAEEMSVVAVGSVACSCH
jgi:hypothetical protein